MDAFDCLSRVFVLKYVRPSVGCASVLRLRASVLDLRMDAGRARSSGACCQGDIYRSTVKVFYSWHNLSCIQFCCGVASVARALWLASLSYMCVVLVEKRNAGRARGCVVADSISKIIFSVFKQICGRRI